MDPIVDCDAGDFVRIHSDMHCTVHPSKSEGFGMVPFQSVACETPVIAPHTTGMADYLNEANSIRLETNGRVAGEGVGNAAGTYFGIDKDHLVHCLRHVVDSWAEEYAKVQRAGSAFREEYRWEVVLEDFIGLVRDLLSARDEYDQKRLISSRATQGQHEPGGTGVA